MPRLMRAALWFIILIISNRSINPTASEQASRHMGFVTLIQKRFYLVHRLEKPIALLLKFYSNDQKQDATLTSFFDKKSKVPFMFKPGASDYFSNQTVKKYIKAAEVQNEISPLYKLFADFLSYKFIDDDLFVKETIVVIVLLYKDIIAHQNSLMPMDIVNNLSVDVRPHEDLSMNIMLKLIDKVASYQEKYESHMTLPAQFKVDISAGAGNPTGYTDRDESLPTIVNLLDESYETTDFVINNNMRFYHIARLLKSIVFLARCRVPDQCNLWPSGSDAALESIDFKDPTIKNCLMHIRQTKSIKPILKLWHHFVSYNFINNPKFLHEFVLLIYIVYQQSINHLSRLPDKEGISAGELFALYQKISELPIPELLNALDTVVDQLIVIMEVYEINSHIGLWDWVKKYWWFGPVVMAAFLSHIITSRLFPASQKS